MKCLITSNHVSEFLVTSWSQSAIEDLKRRGLIISLDDAIKKKKTSSHSLRLAIMFYLYFNPDALRKSIMQRLSYNPQFPH